MWLELPVRWSEEDKSTKKVEELIHGESLSEKMVHTYGKLIIDAMDIGPYYNYDSINTMINDKLGKVYCVTIPINEFRKILTEVTGNAIMTITVKTDTIKDKPPTRGKESNLDDDIIT
ncbi:MAG: hypothetical protein WCK31_05345 [bacterium]